VLQKVSSLRLIVLERGVEKDAPAAVFELETRLETFLVQLQAALVWSSGSSVCCLQVCWLAEPAA
jgi:hypothetical protein